MSKHSDTLDFLAVKLGNISKQITEHTFAFSAILSLDRNTGNQTPARIYSCNLGADWTGLRELARGFYITGSVPL